MSRIATHSTGPTPTVDNEPDLRDKVVLITGANSGLGFETAVHLARKECILVMCCRNMEAADEARREIMKRSNMLDITRIRIVELDLADFDDVEKFPIRYDREMGDFRNHPIDIVILNAGIMAPHERQLTRQGIEMQLASNVLGHFKFLAKIFPRIKQAPHGRIVFVSSGLHVLSQGKIDFSDLNRDKSYWKMIVYGETKLGALLLMYRLNRLLEKKNINNVIAVAAHPGYSSTKIHDHTIAHYFNNWCAQNPDKSAKSFVVAAIDPQAERNGYCGPRFFAWGDPSWGASHLESAKDQELQDKFWEACEQFTNAHLEEVIMQN